MQLISNYLQIDFNYAQVPSVKTEEYFHYSNV